jgi:hypothetical protein
MYDFWPSVMLYCIDVALGAIEILDGLDVPAQAPRGEGGSRPLPEQALDGVGREDGGTFNGDRPHLVGGAFLQIKPDHQGVRGGKVKSHVADLEIEVALFEIEILELHLVLLKLVFLEAAGTGQPRKPPALARLDHLAQLLLGVGFCALEDHAFDLDLGRLGDLKGRRAPPRGLVDVDHVFHLGAGVALLFVHLLQFATVREEFSLIQRLARLGGHLLHELARLDVAVALDPDLSEPGLALEDVG